MSEPNEAPLDLSALDPGADAVRWQAYIDATIARAVTRFDARTESPIELIASWSRPLMLVAALLVALLVPVELLLEVRERRSEQVAGLVTLSAASSRGLTPSGSDIARALTPELNR